MGRKRAAARALPTWAVAVTVGLFLAGVAVVSSLTHLTHGGGATVAAVGSASEAPLLEGEEAHEEHGPGKSTPVLRGQASGGSVAGSGGGAVLARERDVAGPPSGPFCAGDGGRKSIGALSSADKEFYSKYQKSVLHDRKPFALDKGFLDPAIRYHSDKKLWLDAGAGTCGTMRHLKSKGVKVFGVELSEVCKSECADLAKQGEVFSSGLDAIPFPSRHFDLVWSSEVFEHVPPHLLNASVAEVVRVAKRDLFLTIAMKRSGFDPDPPEKPRIHIAVLPRRWWDALFGLYGCRVNTDVRSKFGRAKYSKATFFPYICHEGAAVVPPECDAPVANFLQCYIRYSGDVAKCNAEKGSYEEACHV